MKARNESQDLFEKHADRLISAAYASLLFLLVIATAISLVTNTLRAAPMPLQLEQVVILCAEPLLGAIHPCSTALLGAAIHQTNCPKSLLGAIRPCLVP